MHMLHLRLLPLLALGPFSTHYLFGHKDTSSSLLSSQILLECRIGAGKCFLPKFEKPTLGC